MKKIVALLLCLALLFLLPISINAEQPLIVDDADILSASQRTDLEAIDQDIRSTYHLDIVIATVKSLDHRSAQNRAIDFYRSGGYGEDGLILLLSMEGRDWAMYTFGKGSKIFSDQALAQLEDAILPQLRHNNYSTAFSVFLENASQQCHSYELKQANKGHLQPLHFLLALIIGAIVGGIVILIMRSAMNTARAKPDATEYVKKGTFHPFGNIDMYLYSHVTRIRKQENNSGPHGGGGGGGHGRSGKF